MSFTEIAYDVADHILTITLDRPDRLNAFTGTMMRELIEAFDRADADDDVRAVIVTGRGRGFCAGADLGGGGDTFAEAERAVGDDTVRRDGGGQVTMRIYASIKPVIAAINGPAVGVGATMTLPMDVRLASTTAKMGFVFARRGITTDAAASWFLPRVVGISQAAEWCLTGRVFPAEEAHQARLVTAVYEPDDLLPAARRIAREIADNTSAVSVAVTRQLLWQMLGADHPMEAHKLESRLIPELGRNADSTEGIEAFLAKRPAVYRLGPSTGMPSSYPWWEPRPFA